jgi:laminin beta 1
MKLISLDEEEELVAGQCHCKLHVDGARCDRCQNGYWNFTLENPDGCQGKTISSNI